MAYDLPTSASCNKSVAWQKPMKAPNHPTELTDATKTEKRLSGEHHTDMCAAAAATALHSLDRKMLYCVRMWIADADGNITHITYEYKTKNGK